MSDQAQWRRVYWHSRRGMLELDIALLPFVEEVYLTLPEQQQAIYRRLLESEDNQLFSWVLQKEKPADPELAMIMEKIINHARKNKD